MKIRITAGTGVGQVIDAIPAVANARIAGGTAIAVDPSDDLKRDSRQDVRQTGAPETAALDPGERAVSPAQRPPKRKTGRR